MVRGLRDSIAPVVLAYTLLVVCIGTFLGSAIVGRERLAFRDVSHFYTPLYGYVAARQSEDWGSLWNPLDLTGMPLAGETTTAVFYPVRIAVYALAPSSETAMTWYVVIHLLIAAVAIHIAAKSAGASPLGCGIAILTYPLAGPIFFLIYNPPFLVGAAWMPIAIAGGLRLLMTATKNALIAITGIALAMPILGGDPQSTIHVLFLGALTWLFRFWRNDRHQWRLRAREFGRLVVALAIAGCISAPQLAASIDWSIQSDRMEDGAASDRFDFSIQPWHWFELIVPEISGRLFPTYERLSNAIPGDGRSWTMTLYAGIIPLVLVIHRFLSYRAQRLDLWDYLLPVGLVLAISGPYWLITTLVPGYDAFRYPAKWLPLVPLGLAIVAARQAQVLATGQCKSTLPICLALSLSIVVVALASVVAPSFGAIEHFESLELVDRFWGPLQPERAFKSIIWSAIVSTLVTCGFWGLIRTQRSNQAKSLSESRFALAVLCLVGCDLALATRHQVATVIRTEPTPQAAELGKSVYDPRDGRAMRTTSNPAWPSQWLEPHDGSKRLLEVETSQRATRFGRWHLSNREAVFNSVTSLRPQRIDAFWTALASINRRDANATGLQSWPAIESWLGISHQWATQLPAKEIVGNAEFIVVGVEKIPSSKLAPMHRWDASWRPIANCPRVSNTDMEKRLGEIIAENSKTPPLVECDASSLNETMGSASSPEAIDLILAKADRWIFHIETSAAGLLSVKTYQDGNWHASLRSLDKTESNSPNSQATLGHSSPVLRVDYLFMGIKVPPGRWEIRLHYRPWWLLPSLFFSVFGISISLLLLISHRNKPMEATARLAVDRTD